MCVCGGQHMGGYNGLILYRNPVKPGSMGSNPSHSRVGDSGCTRVPIKNSRLYSSASVAMAAGGADQLQCLYSYHSGIATSQQPARYSVSASNCLQVTMAQPDSTIFTCISKWPRCVVDNSTNAESPKYCCTPHFQSTMPSKLHTSPNSNSTGSQFLNE